MITYELNEFINKITVIVVSCPIVIPSPKLG